MSAARAVRDKEADAQLHVGRGDEDDDFFDLGDDDSVTYTFPDSLKNKYHAEDEHVGIGGYAVVWKARPKAGGTPVAIKLFHYNNKLLTGKYLWGMRRANPAFFNVVTASADHCNKVKLILGESSKDPEGAGHICKCNEAHISQDIEYPYVVQEFCGGTTVMSLLGTPNMNVDYARFYMVQLMKALRFLAKLTPPIIHHDIKPDNMAVAEDGVMKLIDFESVMSWDDAATLSAQTDPTPAYAPPEAQDPMAFLKASQVPYAYDAFSAGVTYWQMLCPMEAYIHLPEGLAFHGNNEKDKPAFSLMDCEGKKLTDNFSGPGEPLDRLVIRSLTSQQPANRGSPDVVLSLLQKHMAYKQSNDLEELNLGEATINHHY